MRTGETTRIHERKLLQGENYDTPPKGTVSKNLNGGVGGTGLFRAVEGAPPI